MVVVTQASNWGGSACRCFVCGWHGGAACRLCGVPTSESPAEPLRSRADVNEGPLRVGCVRGRLRKWLELATIPTMTILLVRKNELEGYERGRNGPSWGFGKPERGLIQRSSRPMVGTVDNSNHF